MSVDITSAQQGVDGTAPAKPLKAVGSLCPIIPFSVSGAGVSTTSDTATVTFPQITTIRGAVVQARLISDGTQSSGSDEIKVTWSGNVLTIVEVNAGDIEVNVYSGFVWGDVKLA